MRTNRPRHARSSHALAGQLSLLSLLGIMLAGCPDALRIELPPGSDAGPGDGGEVVACESNPDCTYPTAVCDTVKRTCVECLAALDCAAKPGTVCSLGKCACADATQGFCPKVSGAQADRCVNLQTAKADCGACNHTCIGACVAGVCSGGWEAISTVGAPISRSQHVAVSDEADKVMIVWGGLVSGGQATTNTGGIYNLAANTWTETSTLNAPSPRRGATAVWDDADGLMLVWGGSGNTGSAPLNTGASFDPKTNTWQPLPTEKAPSARFDHTAVWTGTKMIIWGGTDGMERGDGAAYDPKQRSWTPIAQAPMFGGRINHTVVWTGMKMLIWGGSGFNAGNPNMVEVLADGTSYDASADAWALLPPDNRPSARQLHSAVWTGSAMLIWGGVNDPNFLADGAKFDGTSFSPLSPDGAPEGRSAHSAVWISATREMIVFGGENKTGLLDTGYRFDEATSKWTQLPSALAARARHTAVVVGSKMLLWGGDIPGGSTNTGGIFDATVK